MQIVHVPFSIMQFVFSDQWTFAAYVIPKLQKGFH